MMNYQGFQERQIVNSVEQNVTIARVYELIRAYSNAENNPSFAKEPVRPKIESSVAIQAAELEALKSRMAAEDGIRYESQEAADTRLRIVDGNILLEQARPLTAEEIKASISMN